jgi:hypothetical protein
VVILLEISISWIRNPAEGGISAGRHQLMDEDEPLNEWLFQWEFRASKI